MSQTVEFNLSQILSNPLDFTNILFVSKGGNDTTALTAGKYDFNKQWLNPTVAMANASIGDTVIVYAGEYTIGTGGNVTDDGSQYMVKNGVTLYMMDGAFINYTNQTGTFSLPFFDGGVAAIFNILGKGKFKFNRDITGGDTFQCTTNIATTLNWEFDELDIRRRLGTTGHNAAYWRMKGRKWLNRESMLFAFRFPAIGTTDRQIYIEVEETEILSENANNTWTRAELRNYNGASKAHISLGYIEFPHAFTAGAFFTKINCTSDSNINFYAKSCLRVNNNNIRDYIISGLADFSSGITDIKNIDTPNGLVAYGTAGGLASVKKTETFQGRVRNGYTGLLGSNLFLTAYNLQTTNIKCNLDIVMDSLTVSYFGNAANNAVNTTLSGRIVWHNTSNAPVQINVGTTNTFRLESLVLSEIPVGIPSVINLNAIVRNLRVLNTFATNAVSSANGGINQLIETIKINSNI